MHGIQVILSTDLPSMYPMEELALLAIAGGADGLQLRHKGPYTRELYLLGLYLSDLCKKASIPLIVNDRFDIALSISASGVHLGQEDLPISLARQLLGPAHIIGASLDTKDMAKADYIGFGHIFATKTKTKPYPPRGLELLKEKCGTSALPIIAVGGITLENIAEVAKCGVAGVAVASAVSSARYPEEVVKRLKRELHANAL